MGPKSPFGATRVKRVGTLEGSALGGRGLTNYSPGSYTKSEKEISKPGAINKHTFLCQAKGPIARTQRRSSLRKLPSRIKHVIPDETPVCLVLMSKRISIFNLEFPSEGSTNRGLPVSAERVSLHSCSATNRSPNEQRGSSLCTSRKLLYGLEVKLALRRLQQRDT